MLQLEERERNMQAHKLVTGVQVQEWSNAAREIGIGEPRKIYWKEKKNTRQSSNGERREFIFEYKVTTIIEKVRNMD